jgi:hypothetical protein
MLKNVAKFGELTGSQIITTPRHHPILLVENVEKKVSTGHSIGQVRFTTWTQVHGCFLRISCSPLDNRETLYGFH